MSNKQDPWKKIEIPSSVQERTKNMDPSPFNRYWHAFDVEEVLMAVGGLMLGAAATALTVNIWLALGLVLIAGLIPVFASQVQFRLLERDWRTKFAMKAVQAAVLYNKCLFMRQTGISRLKGSDEDAAEAATQMLARGHQGIVQTLAALDAFYESSPDIAVSPPMELIGILESEAAAIERAQQMLAEKLEGHRAILEIMDKGELKDY